MSIDLPKIARARRKELKLRQKDVADLAHCSVVTVGQFETYKQIPRYDMVLDIINALGLEIEVREAHHDN